jgi:hypothetical protein
MAVQPLLLVTRHKQQQHHTQHTLLLMLRCCFASLCCRMSEQVGRGRLPKRHLPLSDLQAQA